MLNSLRTKFLLTLLMGGVLLSLFGSWLSYLATVEQLQNQLLQRAYTLGTAIDEAIKIARNDVEIHFAVENIIKKETGIIGITVATKAPFIIWASSFHSKTDRNQMTQNMLSHLKPSLNHGIFGYHFNQNGDLEMLFPLSSLHSNSATDLSRATNFYASQEINPLLLKSKEADKGYQFLPGKSYRGAIHLLFGWSEIESASADLFWFSIITLLSGIAIITVFATTVFYRTVLKPINIIRSVIHQQYQGDRTARIPTLSQDEIGELGLTFNTMVNAIIESEEKIQHQAHFDSLTDIPNRFLSLDRLNRLIRDAQRNNTKVAVLFLDLDDFKKINDSLGHETGDKLLIESAQRLSKEVRSRDTVGRLGGDEFIVLLDDLSDSSDAASIAKNLLYKFSTSFRIDGRELMLTVSIGIAIYPGDGENASELLQNADSAMYHSKKLGRNTFSYFTDEMNREVSRRLVLEEHLHGALERGEFTVFYQPKIELDSARIMGAEALLRWHNPTLGNVPPDEFIVIAEQTGLIVSIGQFVLTEALIMTKQWHQNANEAFHIAVNLSPRQFRDPKLVSFVEQTMQQYNISSKSLEMEITEGVLMNGHSYIDDALTALSNLGVSIAMDDFGTGYSSLSYLRSYPFNVLKVDRSFVNDITTDEADRELISAAIAMAHGLKLKVVAEGIETKEQLAYLKKLNCDYGQGYLFSKPVSAKEMTKLLENDLSVLESTTK